MSTPPIDLRNVSLCYRLAKHRVGSFKEYLIHVLRGSLEYRELWALRDVDLVVPAGEVLGVVGANGAGKSTLAKVITGVLRPTRGERRVEGRLAPILELATGFDMELTGYENIYLNALLLGRRRHEVDERLDEIVEFSGLGEFIRSPIRNYSTGMVARLGFSIATAWVPDVLILDEVMAVGDIRFLGRCQERMDRYRRAGTTTVIVSHGLEYLKEHCSRCIWLDHGKVQFAGEPEEVIGVYVRFMERSQSAAPEPEPQTVPVAVD